MATRPEYPIHKKRAWVIFETHNNRPGKFFETLQTWALNRLKKGFSHVVIVKESELDGVFTIINPYTSQLEVTDIYDPDFISKLIENGRHVVETQIRDDCIAFKGLITCVSVAKYLLGITNWRIITPFQLYKFLMKGNENE